MVPILVLLGIAAVIAIIYFSWLSARKRTEALQALAAECGLEFSESDPFDLPTWLGAIHTFSQGYSRVATNVISGTYRGRKIIAFDYKYETGSGKNHSTWRFSACLNPLDVPFPNLLIRPEGFFDKVAEFFGADDIDFESDEFSRKFVVRSPDKKFAYDVCNPQMMEWLLENRGLALELVDHSLVLSDKARWDAERFRAVMDFSAKFFELIPEFVWKEYRERAGSVSK